MTVEESLAGQAEWEAGVTRTAEAYRLARRCWNCHAHWTEAGECPTKGCRGPGSGFERPKVRAEKPCLGCQAPTRLRAMGGLKAAAAGRAIDDFVVEMWPWCARCEQRRNLEQARGVAANPEVYPHIRERCAAYAAELAKEIAA